MITADLDNAAVAAATLDGDAITVSGLSAGTATLTVRRPGDNNHEPACLALPVAVAPKAVTPTIDVKSTSTCVELQTFVAALENPGKVSVTATPSAGVYPGMVGRSVSFKAMHVGTYALHIESAADDAHNFASWDIPITVTKAVPKLWRTGYVCEHKMEGMPGMGISDWEVAHGGANLRVTSSNPAVATASIDKDTYTRPWQESYRKFRTDMVGAGTCTIHVAVPADADREAASWDIAVSVTA